MALVSDVLTYARQLAQTDTNGLTDTAGLAFANDALQNITREMLNRNIDAAQTQETYTSMTVNNPNTYAFPPDMFSLKTIELNFTDQTQQNYLPATELEVANLQNTSFDWLRVNQNQSYPLFDNRGDTYEIFPIPTFANTNGIKMFYFLTPTEYATTGATISYPQSLDYRCLSCRVAALYAISQSDMNMYQVAEGEYQQRLQGIIRILAPASQQPTKPEPLHVTGWNL